MAREKYPDLIELSPKKQLDGLPSLPEAKCGKRNKGCSAHGGGCGYRFKKGDKHWVCPKCGSDRRCWSNRIKGRPACRMHGGRAGRKPTKGYAIYENLTNFNEILMNPDLLNNRMQITALEAIAQDLIEEMTEHDQSALLDDAAKAATMISAGLQFGDMVRLRAGTDMLLEALAPLKNARDLRREYYDNVGLSAKLKELEMKRSLAESGMIPAVVVWEYISFNQRMMFQFIPNANDRAAYMRKLRAVVPEPPGKHSDVSKS